jgi:hypothetical protein
LKIEIEKFRLLLFHRAEGQKLSAEKDNTETAKKASTLSAFNKRIYYPDWNK